MGFDWCNSCDVYNLLEAGIWVGMGLFGLVKGVVRKGGDRRGIYAVLSVFLILFGISDLIEIQTGAWWRPWWLLALKGICLMAFAGCGYLLWKMSKEQGKDDASGQSRQ